MKKKLEADLISIAHRVLQMKNKSDIDQLFVETQKLYEKLSVLRFVEEHFSEAKPTIGRAEVIEKMEDQSPETPVSEIVQEETVAEIAEEKSESNNVVDQQFIEEIGTEELSEEEIEEIPEENIEEAPESVVSETIEETAEEIIEEPVLVTSEIEVEPIENKEFIPDFKLVDLEETPKKPEAVQISFEDFLGVNYDENIFVKLDHNKEKSNPLDFDLPKEVFTPNETTNFATENQAIPKEIESKTTTIEKSGAGISIGLNDRVAFVKHLFGNSNEDYNRVLNQLITFDSMEEANEFIENMVKPDYNNWEGKEEYSERFIQIIEKKFV